jgi:two-component system, NtrC family, sensor histidine kinase HydH
MSFKKLSAVKIKYITIIFLVITALMIMSAYFEFYRNKSEIFHLLDEYANSMIYTIDKSSANAIVSDREMENLLTSHLLGVARNVSRLDSITYISNVMLKKIAEENQVYRINVFDSKGDRAFSNVDVDSIHLKSKGKYSPLDYIKPILEGKENEIVIGLKEARFEKGKRFAVAVKRPANKKGAIIVNLDAESYLEFRSKIGFGKILREIGNKSGIEYIILQNKNETIAANKSIEGISGFSNDKFLSDSFNSGETKTRIALLNGKNIYEAIKPFIVDGEKIGLFRIGLSMDEIDSAESRMFTRGIVISITLIFILVIFIAIIISNQNYKIIKNEFNKIQTFTGDILGNMSQAVITLDANGNVKIFNKTAESLFGICMKGISGKNVKELFLKKIKILCDIFEKTNEVKNFEIEYYNNLNERRILSLNSTINYNKDERMDSFTFVISDVTDSKMIEEQMRRNEKLIAMGSLASAVAHEVRNPLNSINMIAQRYEKEFSGKVNSPEFSEITNVLKSESKRVNNIVEEFLKFARPQKLNKSKIQVKDFLDDIEKLFSVQIAQKEINLSFEVQVNNIIEIDAEQMKQVLINIIQNSIDSIDKSGDVTIKYYIKDKSSYFEITDTGCGIQKENLNKIFNLYFTTKKKGNGLGLSIVQQIVYSHNGKIFVDSLEGNGTKFVIEIPLVKIK